MVWCALFWYFISLFTLVRVVVCMLGVLPCCCLCACIVLIVGWLMLVLVVLISGGGGCFACDFDSCSIVW